MEDQAFDRIARTIAADHSRRAIVKLLVAGVAGVVTARRGGDAGAAPRCKRVNQACKTTADCCPDQNGTYCAADRTCQPCAGAVCKGGCVVCPASSGQVVDPATCLCACPAGTHDCGGTCVAVDAANCEGCGVPCPTGAICTPTGAHSGRCECPLGTTFCIDRCVATAIDAQNCGACGHACGAAQVCASGACACPSGTPCGALCCHPETNNPDCCADQGVCTNLVFDPANCVTCGNACLPGDICSGGCCTPIYHQCSPTDDRCCGASTCTGTFNGQTVCCGVGGVSSCSTGAQCCSGACDPFFLTCV